MVGALALVVAVFLTNAATATAQARADKTSLSLRSLSPALRAELLAAREAIWRAWFANDRARVEELLPQHVIAINNGDTTWQDRRAVLASAEIFARDGGKLVRLAFPRTEFQVYGDVAILYSLFELEIEQRGNRTVQRGRATEIFVRRGGRWQNPGWHLDSGS